jgi:putative aminopeptidase FrvX
VDKNHRLFFDFGRGIERGTQLTFKPNFRETKETVQCCYLDNRLGIYIALKVCETLQNGIVVFSSWEEHGGGSVSFLAKFIYEKYEVRSCLVCDITWVTDGVLPGHGTVVSMRDKNIPRRAFIDQIIKLAEKSNTDFQLEVEGEGSSDGRELQVSPYPIDWCFIGPPESNVHSPDELAHKKDIEDTIKLYASLMKQL